MVSLHTNAERGQGERTMEIQVAFRYSRNDLFARRYCAPLGGIPNVDETRLSTFRPTFPGVTRLLAPVSEL